MTEEAADRGGLPMSAVFVSRINQLVQFRLLGLHLDRLADIVTAVPETDAAAPQSLDVKGAIKVRDLSFRYGASDQLILLRGVQVVDIARAPAIAGVA